MLIFGSFDLVSVAFGACNILRLASYGPQIVAVARDHNGATAISFTCWSIWVCANASTGLYAWINLGDAALTVISAFNTSCCIVVLILAAYKRAMTPRVVIAHGQETIVYPVEKKERQHAIASQRLVANLSGRPLQP